MNIHEHQAKEVLDGFGPPVAAGVAITNLDQAEAAFAALPGPVWVVKSQINASGRGKGKFKELRADAEGGVQVSFSADEALVNAHEMFGQTLVTKLTGPAGKQVNRLYIQTCAIIDSELYLSILVDRESGQTSLVASTEGGKDIDTVAHDTPKNIHTIEIAASKGVTDADANKIAAALQLTGTARVPVKGTEFIDILEMFLGDPDTRSIIMVGEIGGAHEEDASQFRIDETKKGRSKPTVGFIAGRTVPLERTMGHAGAVIADGKGGADD